MDPKDMNKFFLLIFITIMIIILNGCGVKQEPCMPLVLMQSSEYMEETRINNNPVIRNNGDILKRNNELYEALMMCNKDKQKLREERLELSKKLQDYLDKNNIK